jgi:hypothetical protein
MPTREQVSILKDFGLNTVHLYGESFWDENGGQPGYLLDKVDSLVSWTAQDSLYVVLTFAGLDINNESNISFVKNCWEIYSERYKDESHMIFEIFNEPGSVPYSSNLIDLEKELYTIIHSRAPETHILLMSPYCIFYDEILSDIASLGDSINWNNASFAGHVYSISAQDHILPIRNIQEAGYAVTITEFHSIENKYANRACLQVFEDEAVSYLNFIPIDQLVTEPSLYQSRIESSEIRWIPDFGTWPQNIPGINYISPYQYYRAGDYDDGSGWWTGIEEYYLYGISENDYVGYNNLDFDHSPESFEAICSSEQGSGQIEIHLDSIEGLIVGVCEISATSSFDNYASFSCEISDSFSGVHNIYLVFKGDAPDWRGIFNIKSWFFVKPSDITPQTPFPGSAHIIPGKIEAEDYDLGGQTISFLDSDTTNHGSIYRDDAVDIQSSADNDEGYNVGWIESGEWLEYTFNTDTSCVMDIQFRIACTDPGEKIRITLNNQNIGSVTLPDTYGWQNWETILHKDIAIPKGENQLIRLEFLESGFNINWMNFIAKEVVHNSKSEKIEPVTIFPNPASEYFSVRSDRLSHLEIYSMYGKLLLSKMLLSADSRVMVNYLPPGEYVLKIFGDNEIHSKVLIIIDQ